jgi:hypothetical protein
MRKTLVHLVIVFTLGFGLWAATGTGVQVAPDNSGPVEPSLSKSNSNRSQTDGWIATRAELEALLAGTGTTDDFETYDIAEGDAEYTNRRYMDYTTKLNGQGPGLVNLGAGYHAAADVIQWNGKNWYGLPNKTISSGTPHIIQYHTRTQVIGIDLHAFAGFGQDARVDIFDANYELVDTKVFTLPGDASAAFVGYQYTDGIIRWVSLTSLTYGWSPILNDHTYGEIGGGLTLSIDQLVGGQTTTISVTNAVPNDTVIIAYSPHGGGPTNSRWGINVYLTCPISTFAWQTADGSGNVTLSGVCPNNPGNHLWFQALDLEAGDLSNGWDGVIQ